jgi:diguanylate cyclase (GGDEF)-like protein
LERFLTACRLFFLPGGALLGALVLVVETRLAEDASWREALVRLPEAVPALLLVGALLLAAWLHQQRLAVAIWLFLALERGAAWWSAAATTEPSASSLLCLLLLWANLLWIGFLPTRRRLLFHGLGPFALIATLHLLAGWLVLGLPAAANDARRALGGELLHAALATPLTQLSLGRMISIVAILALAAGAPLLRRGIAERSAVDHSIFWAAIAMTVAILGRSAAGAGADLGTSAPRSVYWLAVGLLAVLAALQASRQLAYFDELTGLPTRRAFQDALAELRGRYAIAMVDIDHFKSFNDRYGHEVGDQVLRAVAARLLEVSGGGRPFRHGGEEFAILFPGLTLREAAPHVERFREQIASEGFLLRGRDRPRRTPRNGTNASTRRKQVALTISAGVAEPTAKRRTAEAVVIVADAALYRAKQAGRNKVVYSASPGHSRG